MGKKLTDEQLTIVIANERKNNGAPTYLNLPIDTITWKQATFYAHVNNIDTTFDCKIQESDVAGSGYADITDAAITQLTGTSDDSPVALEIDCTVAARKRYLQPVVVVGNGTIGADIILICVLSGYRGTAEQVANAGQDEIISV